MPSASKRFISSQRLGAETGSASSRDDSARQRSPYLWLLIGTVLGFTTSQLLLVGSSGAPTSPQNTAVAEPVARETVKRLAAMRSAAPKPASAAIQQPLIDAGKDDEEETLTPEEKQAAQVTTALFGRIAALEQASAGYDAEVIANKMLAYQQGYADGVRQAGPEVVPHLAEKVERTICNENSSDASLVVAARLILDLPEIATARGFECAFAPERPENVVTWTMLDAWRRSDVGETPAIEQLRGRATSRAALRKLGQVDN